MIGADSASTLTLAAHRAFGVAMVGPVEMGVDATEAADLVRLGFLTPKEALRGWSVPGVSIPMDPFQFAVMMGSIMAEESAAPGVLAKSWAELTKLRGKSLRAWVNRVNYRLKRRIKFGEPSTVTRYTAPDHLSPEEAGAWLSARTRAAGYITAIGEDARHEVRQMVNEAIAEQVSWRTLEKRLRARFGVWSSKWERVARTELQGAYNEGAFAAAIATKGFDALIARVPEKDACEHCLRLLLDEKGRPKIFTARELLSNGTNVGKKPAQWLATIWPIHPNCRCDTVSVPAGYGFDDSWNLVPSSMIKSFLGSYPLEQESARG